ncbi:MAG: tripartite tricarboxylate transporter substrate binding protein [Sutterella sp.]|nr:tripartite tricarboxylate transporter substrate binding protein [Sutterella sp.]
MIQRRTFVGAIGAVALSSAFYFPVTSLAAMPKGEGTNPIRIVVPYPPGGPLDVSARTISEAVTATLGNVIVDNRPGAGGGVGMGYVKRQPGDGYTLVVGAVATHAINPHLYKKLPYDAKKDFKPVTLIAHVPNVLVITPDFQKKTGIKSVRDLVAYAKANPGKLNYASGGNGSAGHMAGEWLKNSEKIDMVHVPFAGAAAARLSVLAGQTDLIFDNLASCTANIQAGKLIPLAVTTKVRTPALPDVPTMEEAGIANFDISTWYGLFVPAATPDDVVNGLNKAIVEALNSPAVKERLAKLGGMASPTTPAEFGKLVDAESAKYAKLVKLSGAKVD